MKFLIVDDDPAILKITSKFLELEGHEVVCCENALDALKELNSLDVDIVITDATMPAYSGFDLIRSIRKKKDLNGLTVAMLTGRSERSDIEQALELGVQDYIVKPIDPEVFVAKANNLINKHRSSAKVSPKISSSALHSQMTVPISVTRVTDIGVSIETPFLMQRGTIVDIKLKEFAEMGITSTQFKTIFSKSNKRAKSFQSELLLMDLDANQKKQLETLANRWVLKKAS